MISIARKNLFAEKLRLFISIGGVIFSTFLILVLLGIYTGLNIQMNQFVSKTQASLWVMEEGSRDMFHGSSLLADDLKSQIERKIDNGRVYRLITRATQLVPRQNNIYTTKRQREKYGKKEDVSKATIYLIGFDTATGVGGPWKIKEGKATPGKDEVIVDEMLAKNKNLRIGDEVEILNEIFSIAGISAETNIIIQQMVFMDFDQAQDLLNFKGKINYYLVSLDDPEKRFEVKEKINRDVPRVVARTKKEFARLNAEMVNDSFMPIIFTIVIIGFLVGAVVVGLTTYTATMEKAREYGILKAIGAKNSVLYRIVFEQSLWIVFLGFIGGSLLTYITIPLIQKFAAIMIVINWQVFVESAAAAFLMSIVASYIPIRKITGIDPVAVFK